MRYRKTLWLLALTLIFSAFACNLPQGTPAPASAPTDAGFQAPTQASPQETEAPGGAPQTEVTPQPVVPGSVAANVNRLTVGTTTSLAQSGLLDVLLNQFRSQTGYEVIVETGGAGRVLRLAEKSIVDVLLVNEPGSEQKFMDDGFGRDRIRVMYADYVIVGPAADPASIKSATSAAEAFKKIADTQERFYTRDNQGVETKLWKAAGITPQGDWYVLSSEGPVGTLKLASDAGGYSLIDRATFLENKDKFKLEILYQDDELLIENYHVLTVNPDRSPKINYDGALALAQFLTSPEAQAIIQQFGVDRFGQPVFFPASKP